MENYIIDSNVKYSFDLKPYDPKLGLHPQLGWGHFRIEDHPNETWSIVTPCFHDIPEPFRAMSVENTSRMGLWVLRTPYPIATGDLKVSHVVGGDLHPTWREWPMEAKDDVTGFLQEEPERFLVTPEVIPSPEIIRYFVGLDRVTLTEAPGVIQVRFGNFFLSVPLASHSQAEQEALRSTHGARCSLLRKWLRSVSIYYLLAYDPEGNSSLTE